MQTKPDLSEIKTALQKAVSVALNEAYMNAEIELSEVNLNGTCSAKGSFQVITFLSQTVKRKGKFEATLDENLKIVILKITEDQQ